jgi:XapX domain-containing protein
MAEIWERLPNESSCLGGINMIYIKCLLTGFVTGAVFGFLKLPIPAPMVLEGVVGIFGIFLGYRLVKLLFKLL